MGMAGRLAVAQQWLLARLSARSQDGFILIESAIAISVITIVMAAVGTEFVSTLVVTTQQRAQQGAVQVAGSAMDGIRALHASDLVSGRDTGSVDAQFDAAPPLVTAWLSGMDRAYDAGAPGGSGATAAVPTSGVPASPAAIDYTVDQYLGWCWVRTTGSDKSCVSSTTLGGATGIRYLRAVVAVTWDASHCPSSTCAYVTATLVSTAGDHTFRSTAPAYPSPVVSLPGDQTSVVGDPVSLQLMVRNGTGVPPFTWAQTGGSLPTGLSVSPSGLVTGTVAGPPGTYSATVTVTDAYLRTGSGQVSWTVTPALSLVNPGPQATFRNQTIVPLQLSASGGDGGPYTYTKTGNLPAGLVLSSAGVISGKPTTVGTSSVTVRVQDSTKKHSDTQTFTWTVSNPPIVATNPGRRVSTVGTAIRPLTLTASGGSGSFAWSDPTGSLPAGLTISPAGVVSGTPTAVASGTPVILRVDDTAGTPAAVVTFTWDVVDKPTVTAPASPLTLTVGQSVSRTLASTCPDAPCTFSLANGPTGLSVSSAGVLTGSVGGSAGSYPAAVVTVTDTAGASGQSSAFTIQVVAKPAATLPAQTSTIGQSVSIDLAPTCPNGPCTYTLTGGPTGLTISAAGVLTGTVGGRVSTYSAVTVTAKDAGGVTVTSVPTTWNVLAAPTIAKLPATATGVTATPAVALAYTCPAAPCTVSLTGTLADSAVGVGLSASGPVPDANPTQRLSLGATSGTVYMTGLVAPSAVPSGAASAAYGATVSIVDANAVPGAGSTATWTAFSGHTVTSPGPVTVSQNGSPTAGQRLTYSCPTAKCTITATGVPAGAGLTSGTTGTPSPSLTVTGPSSGQTARLQGTVTDPPGAYTVTVTIVSGTTSVSSVGTWTVQ